MNKIKIFYVAVLLPFTLFLNGCAETPDFQVDRYQMDDLRDDDNDGIINQRDLCRETPELAIIDNQGCASWTPVEQITWFEVKFAFDSSEIRKSEFEALTRALKRLADDKKTKLVLIGDTSGEGTLAYNEALAERRNSSIKTYLVSRGVDAGRIEIQIFDQPTSFTAHLKKRHRRTIAVFINQKQILNKEWNIYTSEGKK